MTTAAPDTASHYDELDANNAPYTISPPVLNGIELHVVGLIPETNPGFGLINGTNAGYQSIMLAAPIPPQLVTRATPHVCFVAVGTNLACGQVFQNANTLWRHLYNVHSGQAVPHQARGPINRMEMAMANTAMRRFVVTGEWRRFRFDQEPGNPPFSPLTRFAQECELIAQHDDKFRDRFGRHFLRPPSDTSGPKGPTLIQLVSSVRGRLSCSPPLPQAGQRLIFPSDDNTGHDSTEQPGLPQGIGETPSSVKPLQLRSEILNEADKEENDKIEPGLNLFETPSTPYLGRKSENKARHRESIGNQSQTALGSNLDPEQQVLAGLIQQGDDPFPADDSSARHVLSQHLPAPSGRNLRVLRPRVRNQSRGEGDRQRANINNSIASRGRKDNAISSPRELRRSKRLRRSRS
ncbi:hypothetical protein F5Y13DRAFT_196784 [Hypoxylon sp. FL1857]|nr:hypothetical protein F5Y13DRAFT_196784 [Hypoxylon sp. FL1857]